MYVKVWGCRGSLPTPGAKTLRYGGDSTSIELRSNSGQCIAVDAGSGIRKMGLALMNDRNVSHISLLVTHTHWDHLMGFPFFAPAFDPRFSIAICGGLRGLTTNSAFTMRRAPRATSLSTRAAEPTFCSMTLSTPRTNTPKSEAGDTQPSWMRSNSPWKRASHAWGSSIMTPIVPTTRSTARWRDARNGSRRPVRAWSASPAQTGC